MVKIQVNHRTDEELEVILHHGANWNVNGQHGQVLGVAQSLRQAIDNAQDYALTGSVVVAVCRLPRDNIIVLPPQIDRLCKIIAGRETLTIMETEGLGDAQPGRRTSG